MTYKDQCERCHRALAGPDAAFVCSFDCTFCPECTRGLDWQCPNCSGELNRRPRRTPAKAQVAGPSVTVLAKGDRIRVTRAAARDLDAAARLFDGYRQFYHESADLPAARRFLAERLRRNDSVILLAWKDKEAVGFAQLYPHFTSTRLGRLWNLNDLYVSPAARRRGVASHLLLRCQRLARETGALGVWLDTAVDNPAQHLYAAHGWKMDREFLHFDWSREVGGPASARARRTRSRRGTGSHRARRR